MTETTRKLQLIQLRILLEVDRVCKENNIPYFLVGGTMLGAVRHKGFIPWDDDIDIGMLASDYKRFLVICKTELSSACTLQTIHTDDSCAIPWAKVRLNGTKRIDESEADVVNIEGIDIDVFPYVGMPESDIAQWAYVNIGLFLRGIYFIKCGYKLLNREKSSFKSLGMHVTHLLSKFISKNMSKKMLIRWYNLYYLKKTTYVMTSSLMYNFKGWRVLYVNLIEHSKVMFEGYEFEGPKNIDSYLNGMYGDYMQLPPESQRIVHAIKSLDFGKYQDIDSISIDKLREYEL